MECDDFKQASISLINDGFKPPHLANTPTRLCQYRKQLQGILHVRDNLLDDLTCKRIYEFSKVHKKAWGDYVTTKEALSDNIDINKLWKENPKKAVALVATRALLFDKTNTFAYNTISSEVDVTAVWCLSSTLTNEVEYHIDYAELYRYETNIICPPLYAGTLHVSPFITAEDIQGGDFMVNTTGLENYKKLGYKGKLVSSSELEANISSNEWIRIPYRYRRGIIHDGNFPHLSTPITTIRDGEYRVILGFNCFPPGPAAECTKRAPEHSDVFNRIIRLYQTVTYSINKSNDNTIDIEENVIPSHCETALFTSDINHNQTCIKHTKEDIVDTQETTRNNDINVVFPLEKVVSNDELISSSYQSVIDKTTTTTTTTTTTIERKRDILSQNNNITFDKICKNPFLKKLLIQAAKNMKTNMI